MYGELYRTLEVGGMTGDWPVTVALHTYQTGL